MANSAIFPLMPEQVKPTVHIENQAPIELNDLAASFRAISDEFEAFASKDPDVRYPAEAKLFVKEIRPGSVLADLVNYAPIVITGTTAAVAQAKPVIDALGQTNTVVKFAEHLKKGWQALFKGTKDKSELEKSTLKTLSDILLPIAKDSGSKIEITTGDIYTGNVYNTINYDSKGSTRIRKQAELEINKKEQAKLHIYKKQTLIFFQTRNQIGNTTGDKGRIEAISKKEVKIIFEDDDLKQTILSSPDNLFKNAYIVDVEVGFMNDKPITYKVTALHEKFPLPDAEQDLL
jgi:hypothetical protein